MTEVECETDKRRCFVLPQIYYDGVLTKPLYNEGIFLVPWHSFYKRCHCIVFIGQFST